MGGNAAVARWLLHQRRMVDMNSQYNDPLPSLRRLMIFIDGENLVNRYQAMVDDGRKPKSDVQHEKDTYVWHNNTWVPRYHVVCRATYYTYFCGNDADYEETKEAIRRLDFKQYQPMHNPSISPGYVNTLYPTVFRKQRHGKAKGVDIQMTVDILAHVYQDNLDNVFLLSGDGDYKPVLEECIRRGKHVYVGAFSSGCSPSIKDVADQFGYLDDYYFDPVIHNPV
jgi:uncharacterized LabA/DUF88 family protein